MRFKRLLLLAALLFLSSGAWAQYTQVTATITDTGGSLWANCSYSVAFVPQSTSPGPYTIGGNPTAVFQTVYNGQACDSFGKLSIRLPDNNVIQPQPSQWAFSICSAKGYQPGNQYCYIDTLTITGATQDISTALSAAAPILPKAANSLGVYGTGHLVVTTNFGPANAVIGNCMKWGIGFTADDAGAPCGAGGGGGGTPGGLNADLQFNNAGAFGGASAKNGNLHATFNVTTGDMQTPIHENVRWVDSTYNWAQTDVAGSIGNLSVAGANTITLTPCPLGVDTTNSVFAPYTVYVSGVGTPEAALVTGGTCTSGGATGTLTLTTVNAHAAGFTVGSASTGIQEAINDACGGQGHCTIKLRPANSSTPNYVVHGTTNGLDGTVYLKPAVVGGYRLSLIGTGAIIQCQTRGVCLFNGFRAGAPGGSVYNVVEKVQFDSTINIDGVQITGVAASAGTYTVTATAHPFVNGDYVDVLYHGPNGTQHTVAKVTIVDANHFSYVLGSATFTDPGGTWGWAGLENVALEDNSQGAVMRDIDFSVRSGGQFSNGIIVDNDQNANIDHLTLSTPTFKCTANYCGQIIWGRGDASNAALMHVDKSDLSVNCATNGIRNDSGNTLGIQDSVVQGFRQFGVRSTAGIQGATINNLYEEVGSCTNPQYPGTPIAATGYIGGRVKITGEAPIAGHIPAFTAANPGGIVNNYYIHPIAGTMGSGPILFAGSCSTTGVGNCTVYWPQIPNDSSSGAITYDVLVTVGTVAAPYVGNANSVTTGVTSAACSNGMCTFTDTQAGTTPYTVTTQTWFPNLVFWPGSYVLTPSQNANSSTGTFDSITADRLGAVTNNAASAYGQIIPSFYSTICNPSQAGWSTVWMVCANPSSPSGNGVATVLQGRGNVASTSGLKGRLNLGPSPAIPIHLLTLVDSNFGKTMATAGHRPAYDAADIFVGLDQSGGLSIGAPTSISRYVNNTGDNTNWIDRVNSTGLSVNGTVTVNSGAGGTELTGSYGVLTNPGASQSALGFDSVGDLAYFKRNISTFFRKVIPQDYTVGTLPAASIDVGQLAIVTDNQSSGCPLSGGGGQRVLVRWNGASWDCVSGGGTSIGNYHFAALPVAPTVGTYATVDDWTGTCPVTTGSGTAGHYLLIRWDGVAWQCVTPTNIQPFNVTMQLYDPTQPVGSTGGLHLTPSTGVPSNTSGDLNAIFESTAPSLGANGMLGFVDNSGAIYAVGIWASNLTLPTLGTKKCVDIDSLGHLNFFTGDCLSNPMTTAGDIMYGGTPSGGVAPVTRLGIGTSGQVLTVSAGLLPTWTTLSALTNPMTTTGDLIYSTNNSGTPGRLGVGTAGQVLTMNAGLPTWQNATIGGTVNSGTAGQLTYYAASGTAVSGLANTSASDGVANPVISITPTSNTKEALFINDTTPTNNVFTVQVGAVTKFFIDSSGNINGNSNFKVNNNFTYQNQTANQNVIYSSGLDTNAAQGNATFRAGNNIGTSANAAGSVTIQPGALTNAAPTGTEGSLTIQTPFLKGATTTVGNLACFSANNTVADCGAVSANFVGIISLVSGGSAYIQIHGDDTVNLDASSTFNAGDFVCVSGTVAAKAHMNGTTACSSYTQHVGYAIAGGAAVTTVHVLLVR